MGNHFDWVSGFAIGVFSQALSGRLFERSLMSHAFHAVQLSNLQFKDEFKQKRSTRLETNPFILFRGGVLGALQLTCMYKMTSFLGKNLDDLVESKSKQEVLEQQALSSNPQSTVINFDMSSFIKIKEDDCALLYMLNDIGYFQNQTSSATGSNYE
mmetsp:Transcript_8221/g.13759  ORF Transcript_8221/g.13759 Transcript_8221/m.13759 type:complete len:156 (+) Transcript_8221:551-1018(+)